jgi:hypothetical protein
VPLVHSGRAYPPPVGVLTELRHRRGGRAYPPPAATMPPEPMAITKRVQRRDLRDGVIVALVVAALAALAVSALVSARSDGGGADLNGTDHADSLTGTKRADHIEGRGGKDRIRGRAGADTIDGGNGHDRIDGGPGADVLVSGAGGAKLIGGKGRDGFNMRNGVEVGGKGRDVIKARDGHLDEISCGAGHHDVAVVDRAEAGIYDCERVKVPNSGQKHG